MTIEIKQSTTTYPLVFLMVDSTDHVTGKTGLSPTVTISKAGAAFASPAGAVTEIGSGWYKVAGNATDNATLGPLILHATGAAADPVDVVYNVTARLVDDLATQTSLDTVDGIVDNILLDTAEIGAAGVGLTALATAANLATVAGYLDTEIAAILADTNELQTDWANGGRLDLILDDILADTAVIGADGAGLTALATQTSVNDLPTNAELATALTTSLETNLTEAYRADGAAGSVAELLYEVVAHLGESSISATTKTIKKVDGTTTAATFTLDDSVSPTSITRAT